MFAVKLLLVLGSITVFFLRGEAAGAVCAQRSFSTIQALPGKPGKNGAPGAPGPKGEVGVNGKDGEQGPVGAPGLDGRNGSDGEQGQPGPQGPPGLSGRDGEPGHDGIDGEQGPPGLNGTDGEQGLPGPQGPTGPPGALNYTEHQQLKEEILSTVWKELSMLNSFNMLCERVATSCKELYQCNPALPSEYYNITTPQGVERVYCEMNTTNCGNITGGWIRAAYIDMTNENNTCPQGLNYTVENSTRMCTRSHTGSRDCSSVTFSTLGVPYTKVCGRARGYQYYATEGFAAYRYEGQTNLNDSYVVSLSVTSGSAQNHIWTFAAGPSKDYSGWTCCNCPCAPYPGPTGPSFVGGNYFCESGNTGTWDAYRWYLDDPLWDSQGCASGSTCCDRGGPWFTTTLSQEVSNIEVRMCLRHGPQTDNIGVDQLELYIH